ncbi:uncharacterized protein [Acropora muricata]|uniref:uncharacterized protein isoform X1 n=1 Tax=Acropora muricata TaxID=159855 RepID=UPI0034E485CF
MRIASLSNETFDNLASVLDKDSTIGWKKLMGEGFGHIYFPKHIEEIEQISGSSAKALLDNLDGREESLENLIVALDRIGNKRAISIIQNDITFKTGHMNYYKDRDGRPATRISTCQPIEAKGKLCEPIEHSMKDVFPNREQAQTLLTSPPYSIQESTDNFNHHDNLEPCELFTKIMSQMFPCAFVNYAK